MDKYLVTLEFRYNDAPTGSRGYSSRITTVTVGVFDNIETACDEGNKQLEILEAKFELNPNWMVKERLSPRNRLVTNIAYLRTPFDFYAQVTTLRYLNTEETIENVLTSIERYKNYQETIDD